MARIDPRQEARLHRANSLATLSELMKAKETMDPEEWASMMRIWESNELNWLRSHRELTQYMLEDFE